MPRKQIPPPPAGTDLTGKTILLTGGTDGLGLEAARQMLRLGASRVIITARSEAKGKAVVEALRQDEEVQAANPEARIEAMDLDLDDYSSGLRFVEQVRREVAELDVLLLNAGVSVYEYQTSKSGHERVMQVNVYTNVLIALSLLPLLKSTAAARGTPTHLAIVGSEGQSYHSFDKRPIKADEPIIAWFDDRKHYQAMKRYGQSKLLVNLFVRELASRTSVGEVIVSNLCPGPIPTNMTSRVPFWIKPLIKVIVARAGRDRVQGGRMLVYGSSLAGPESHGKFLRDNQVDETNAGTKFVTSPEGEEFSKRIWSALVEEVSKVDSSLKQYA